MAKRKRSAPEEEGSSYSWMDTYGDMVTLLLCFFVLLFAFSTIDAAKWKDLVGAFTGNRAVAITALDPVTARSSPISPIDPKRKATKDAERAAAQGSEGPDDPGLTDEEAAAIDREFDELYQNLRSYIDKNGLVGEIEVQKQEGEIYLSFIDRILFESGKADILEDSKLILNEIIDLITYNINAISMVHIEGHTDNRPIHTVSFPSNWELSSARAMVVLRYFIDGGFDEQELFAHKLSAAGYGEYHPIDTNDTEVGRARNRRVDFVIESALKK